MYIYYWRSSPYPLLPTFDAPEGNTTCTRRNRSNTPLQALTLANDRVFVEIAKGLAGRILREGGSDLHSQARRAFQVCLAREPSAAEESRLVDFVSAQRAFLTSIANVKPVSHGPSSVAAADSAAWTEGARVLLNLDEFITRE
jgi:hypothetical protein